MAELVPSYILKANRAEQHLHNLKVGITGWANTHPYEAVPGRQGKRKSYHLRFTSRPPQEIGVIAADFVYNVRSGLDHLMAALVPSTERSKVYFPIYFEGVWEDPLKGEDKERLKDRGRWNSDTEKVRPEAIAILKSLQPKETAGQINSFLLVNRVSNHDRHQKLPVLFTGLRGMRIIWTDGEGTKQIGPVDTGDPAADTIVYEDGTELFVPPYAMDVKVAGSPVVAVQIGDPAIHIEIPRVFDQALDVFRRLAILPLAPYVRGR